VSTFPDPRNFDFPDWVLVGEYFYKSDDIVSFGDPLTPENVKEAYKKGIFPWYIAGVPLPWFCPAERAVLEFGELRIPRSLGKEKRKGRFRFTIDHDFRSVINACAASRRNGQPGGTWITDDFLKVYSELHEEGGAHSVEAWDKDGNLAGGLYGIDAGGIFCGESMFYLQPNASRLALLFLIDHLKGRGSTWLDVQVMTDHMRALGAKDIDRDKFLAKLEETQDQRLDLFGSA